MTIINSLQLSHEYIKKVVRSGDTVVDATAGNGRDTVFLARLVGNTGRVIAFDIQMIALDRARENLEKEGLYERVRLINDGHQNMDCYVKEPVRAVMFNLGYLPGGDHSISTKAETTITALEKSMKLLKSGGIITVVVYYGGDSGFDEKLAIEKYFNTVNYREFVVISTRFENQPNCPPVLYCIEKL